MPYIKGHSKHSISHNIGLFVREGRSRNQAVAMALSIARKAWTAAQRRRKAQGLPARRRPHHLRENY